MGKRSYIGEDVVCFICDYWWLILLILALLLAIVLGTRSVWEPQFFPTQTPIPTQTPFPTATQTPTSTPFPSGFRIPKNSSRITLCPGGEAYMTWEIEIPPVSLFSDILFAFDLSSSMAQTIEEIKMDAVVLINDLSATAEDVQIGISSFSTYDDVQNLDSEYLLLQAMTKDYVLIENAIESLEVLSGSDEPYLYVMERSYLDPKIGWRDGSRKLLVIFADEGFQMIEPGGDGVLGTEDDLFFEEVQEELANHDIVVVFIGSTDISMNSEVLNIWSEFVGEVNGAAVTLLDGMDVAESVTDVIEDVHRFIEVLDLSITPEDFKPWISSDTVNNIVKIVQVEITIQVPEDLPHSRVYDFSMKALGDGAVYAEYPIQINVPSECVGR